VKKAKAFENVKTQVGYCGIWCGSCAVGNGTLRELSQGFFDLIEGHGLAHWGPKALEYDRFVKELVAMQGIPLCPGCRRGGGRTRCELRDCAQAQGLADCLACGTFKSCRHGKLLGHMRCGALKAGLFVKVRKGDSRTLVAGWTRKLKHQWPGGVLFLEG